MVSSIVTAVISALLLVGGAGTMAAIDETNEILEGTILETALEMIGIGEDDRHQEHKSRHIDRLTNRAMLIETCISSVECTAVAEEVGVDLTADLEMVTQKIVEIEACTADPECKHVKRAMIHPSSAHTHTDNVTEKAHQILDKSHMKVAMISACSENVDCTVDVEVLQKMSERAEERVADAEACLADSTDCDDLQQKGKRGHHRGKHRHR